MFIKVLYFFPQPIVNKNHGNVTRAIQFLEYFEQRSNKIQVDYVTNDHSYIEEERSRQQKMFPYIRSFFLHKKRDKSNPLSYFIKGKIPYLIDQEKQKKYHRHVKSNVTYFEKEQFNAILQSNEYDFIIISYVNYSHLVRNNACIKNAKLILDTHDLMTGQYKNQKGFRLGATFEEEINILNEFNETWSLSSDELYMFSQFATKAKHRFIPIMFTDNTRHEKCEKHFDLIYVASDNPNNQAAAQWFFNKVYPLLPKHLKICVIGGITDFIPADLANVSRFRFVDDLKDLYLKSRISICPMLEGTGVKVKVVEALSFGLPVVCTLRGLDGLPVKKYNGCLMAEDETAFVSHINGLLSDMDLYKQVQKDAIEMFEKYFEVKSVYKQLDKILHLT